MAENVRGSDIKMWMMGSRRQTSEGHAEFEGIEHLPTVDTKDLPKPLIRVDGTEAIMSYEVAKGMFEICQAFALVISVGLTPEQRKILARDFPLIEVTT